MLRLDGPDVGSRRTILDGNRNAAGQAAAATGDDDGVEVDAQRLRLPRQLQPDRALAGDYGRIVEGRHQHHALVDIGANDAHAVVAESVERHHFGAHRPHIADLHRRRVGGHGDDGPDAEHGGGGRHALRMVPRGKGDDTTAAVLRAQRRQLVVGAAELERARALQRFRLEQDPAAEALVESGGFKERRLDDQAGKPARGGMDIGNAGKGGHGGVSRDRVHPCCTKNAAARQRKNVTVTKLVDRDRPRPRSSSSQGEAGAKLRREDPGIHAMTSATVETGQNKARLAKASMPVPNPGVLRRRSRHGSSGQGRG